MMKTPIKLSQAVKKRVRPVVATVIFSAWTIGSVFFIGSSIASLVVLVASSQFGLSVSGAMESALVMMGLSLLVYLIGLVVLLIEPYAVRKMNKKQLQTLLGIARRPRVNDILVALLAWAGYFLMAGIVISLLTSYVPWFDGDQAQQIGFETSGPFMDKIYAFLVIVLAAPIVEELIFRGYLQGNLRAYMPWWLGAVVTSVLFGIAHGQWNVGVDTFLMSMVACYLRERTGSIWAGIGLHMIKNFIAFTFLFLAPEWFIKLLSGA